MRANHHGRHTLWSEVIVAVLLSFGGLAVAAPATAAGPGGAPVGSTVVCRNLQSSWARLTCLSRSRSSTPQRRTPPPRGAHAVCRDGTYSYSQNRWIACRFHGGVGVWLG